MAFSSNNLLKQLDQINIIDWALELKHGKEAYIFLMQEVKSGQLNVNQTRNALHALFRIRYHGSSADVLQAFIDMADHPDISIRSEAVQLAIGLVRFTNKMEKNPLVLSETQERTLRKAVVRGLSAKVTELANEFFL
jgi:hypothetical protein